MNGVLVNKITRAIIQRGEYPRFDGAPIEGMDPTLEWLIDYEPFEGNSYDYDPRYYSILKTENSSASLGDHPNYAGVGQFLITYSLIKNDVANILNDLEAAENNANTTVMPITKQLKYIVIALNALRKLATGINLQSYETTVLTKVATFAGKIADNYNIAAQKEALINANQEPDLDNDWTTE